jgi:hypothetical protein
VLKQIIFMQALKPSDYILSAIVLLVLGVIFFIIVSPTDVLFPVAFILFGTVLLIEGIFYTRTGNEPFAWQINYFVNKFGSRGTLFIVILIFVILVLISLFHYIFHLF